MKRKIVCFILSSLLFIFSIVCLSASFKYLTNSIKHYLEASNPDNPYHIFYYTDGKLNRIEYYEEFKRNILLLSLEIFALLSSTAIIILNILDIKHHYTLEEWKIIKEKKKLEKAQKKKAKLQKQLNDLEKTE